MEVVKSVFMIYVFKVYNRFVLQEPLVAGVLPQIKSAADPQLPAHPPQVRLYGVFRQVEFGRYLLDTGLLGPGFQDEQLVGGKLRVIAIFLFRFLHRVSLFFVTAPMALSSISITMIEAPPRFTLRKSWHPSRFSAKNRRPDDCLIHHQRHRRSR